MFKVQPEALREAALEYAACGGHMAVAAGYHREPSRLEFFENSILAVLEGKHEEFVAQLQQRLEQAALALSDSGNALASTAAMYETTDAQTARELDATYPVVDRSR